jgi:predicted phosphate transport protein (TIGR00153 family)
MGLMRFLPHGPDFFLLFRDAAANAVAAAHPLRDAFDEQQDAEQTTRQLREIEHRGDDATHALNTALHQSFAAPLDHDDVRNLATEIDEFIDFIDEAGRRVEIYDLAPPTESARRFAGILCSQADAFAGAISLLEDSKKRETFLDHVAELHRLENQADDEHNEVLAGLYDGVSDVPGVIRAMRWGEIYGLLEDATDHAGHIANILEGIVTKGG